MQYCIEIQQEYIIIVYPIVHCNGTNMLGIRTVSCLSHYPTAVSIDKLLSVSCSRPRPKGTNPFFIACVLAGNDVWWWVVVSQAQGRVSEGQILSGAFPPSFSFFSLYWLFHDTSFCFFFFPISISPFSVILSFSVLYYFLSSSRSRFPAQAPELDPCLVITLVLAGVHLTRRVPPLSENNAGPLTAAGNESERWTVEWRPRGRRGRDTAAAQSPVLLPSCRTFTDTINMVRTNTFKLNTWNVIIFIL